MRSVQHYHARKPSTPPTWGWPRCFRCTAQHPPTVPQKPLCERCEGRQ